jgi:hypothetical protein
VSDEAQVRFSMYPAAGLPERVKTNYKDHDYPAGISGAYAKQDLAQALLPSSYLDISLLPAIRPKKPKHRTMPFALRGSLRTRRITLAMYARRLCAYCFRERHLRKS